MSLSIIIVNYRSWNFLENCLDSLSGEMQERKWELIVTDNHSADGKLEEFIGRYPEVRFYDSGWNGGFAHGCNLGAARASGATLLFLNPDVVAEPDAISELLKAMKSHPELAILTCGQTDARGRTRKVFDIFPDKLTWFRLVKSALRRFKPDRYPHPRKSYPGVRDCDWVSGSVFMISKADFHSLDGWREDFWMYVEDCDFCLRARQAGLRVAIAGDVKVVHLHGGSSRRNFETSVLTRTEVIISKHLYVHLNFRSVNRVVNHFCVFLTSVPQLFFYWLLNLLTLGRSEMLRTRAGVLRGILGHYFHVIWTRDWHSRQLKVQN